MIIQWIFNRPFKSAFCYNHLNRNKSPISNYNASKRELEQRSISSTFLGAAFPQTGPKSAKSCLIWLSFFALLGSVCVKAARKIMVKSTPGDWNMPDQSPLQTCNILIARLFVAIRLQTTGIYTMLILS